MKQFQLKKLEYIRSKLEEFKSEVDDQILCDLQNTFDGMGERAQEGERGSELSDEISKIEDVVDRLDETIESIREAQS